MGGAGALPIHRGHGHHSINFNCQFYQLIFVEAWLSSHHSILKDQKINIVDLSPHSSPFQPHGKSWGSATFLR
jgi:hypothetical protein